MYTPAFPSTVDLRKEGLTKLEYFAAAAMQGCLASAIGDNYPSAMYVAEYSVAYAKALIKELEDA